jgi:predicted nuclease of predicted toxin-antitoxin system
VRVLLDECMPKRLKRELPGHEVSTVAEQGWAGTKNGALLRRASGVFDVLLTVDQGFEYQQNLASASLMVIILQASSNDFDDLLPLMPRALALLSESRPGQVLRVEA